MRIGLLGCGNIGSFISNAINVGRVSKIELVCIYDKNKENTNKLAKSLKKTPIVLDSVKDFSKYNLDLVVEAASQQAVKENLLVLLEGKMSVLVMSVGALLDNKLMKNVLEMCRNKSVSIYIPSGAIVGLDGVKSASSGKIYDVCLQSIKPKKSLIDNEYLKEKGVNVSTLKKKTLVFDGLATDAVCLFPKSVNVCAALSLAGIGADKTKVKIIVDPDADIIRHIISVKGEFGEFQTDVKNVLSLDNPKTSYMASLSAISTLRKIEDRTINIGT